MLADKNYSAEALKNNVKKKNAIIQDAEQQMKKVMHSIKGKSAVIKVLSKKQLKDDATTAHEANLKRYKQIAFGRAHSDLS